ncbi:MAG: response regulator transcription factor [Corynebacterium variabile]|uniref:response regulator n=1 Tax=Corynebacterium variabile TaxID=1727 RepID=UPI002648FFB8|nr:response regulator transcription factor [Corynebacterium variabile]MDN6536134.1 response regulator transcription factor [Corynebacterium variabile]MDN6662815.1 response regulator transcription factor [Corynebacterium variabile]
MTSPGTAPVTVTIVDDDPYVCAALEALFAAVDDVTVTAGYSSGEDAVAASSLGDVVLMDVRMPGIGGIAATEVLTSRDNPPRVLMLTTFDLDSEVAQSLRAGAVGYLLKGDPPQSVVGAVRRAAAGQTVLAPAVTRQLVGMVADSARRSGEAQQRLSPLTDRELAIARCIGEGLSNAEIAGRLFISVPTVKTHVSTIFRKLSTDSRLQIALLVRDAGLPGHNPRFSPPER